MRRQLAVILVMAASLAALAGSAAGTSTNWSIAIPAAKLARTSVQPGLSKLNSGPVFWGGSYRPGEHGTVAIAGHRTTHSRPFYYLDGLKYGDIIYLRKQEKVFVYRVIRNQTVTPQRLLGMIGHLTKDQLNLSACTPRGSDRFRIVVTAVPQDTWVKTRS